jgi:hypothetical protein
MLGGMPGPASIAAQTDFFTVIDGLLDAGQRDRLWNYFQMQPFQRAESLDQQAHSLRDEGTILRGPTVGWGYKWDDEYPTQTVVDDVMKAIVDAGELFAPTIGRRSVDWEILSATPTILVAGQGHAWHRETDQHAGSWVYFAHREWNIEWGGELFVAHEKDIPDGYGPYLHRLRPMENLPEPPAWRSHLDNVDANELLMARGIGSYLEPKPNRLVVIKGGTPRSVAKVRPSAGRQVRASFGGFFVRKGIGAEP